MNIKTLKERLYDTKLMSLIKNKRDKQKDLEQFKEILKNKFDVIPILQIISSLVLGYVTYTYTSNLMLTIFIISSMMILSMPVSFMLHVYKEIKYEEKLNINSLLEEIKKEISNSTTQKIIVDYINALAMKYPEYQTLSKNIKKSLIENNYTETNNCLELVLTNENVIIEDISRMEEQKKIDEYEKEIGAEIFSNEKMNNKEMEKGWSRIL